MTKRLGYKKHERWIERDDMLRARGQIIAAANHYARQHSLRPNPRILRSKDLHRCVDICRRFALIHPDVLRTAGFNPEPKHKGKYARRTSPRRHLLLERS